MDLSKSGLRPPKSMTLPVNQVLCGDAAELMRGLPSGSVHAIVTDPPYGLGFMGEHWDTFNPKYIDEMMARDKRSHTGIASQRRSNTAGTYDYSRNPEYQKWTTSWALEALRVLKPGASMLVTGGTRTYHRMACGVEDAGFEIKDTILWCYNSGFPKAQDLGKMIDKRLGAEREVVGEYSDKGRTQPIHGGGLTTNGTIPITAPATPLAREWDGWKVGGLKPSYEPVVWAVKPPEGSTTDNVLKHKVGAINVDACRIPFEGDEDTYEKGIERAKTPRADITGGKFVGYGGRTKVIESGMSPEGRYPANMVRTDRFEDGYDRFYFVPKADRGERDEGLEGMPEQEGDFTTCGLNNPDLRKNRGRNPQETRATNIHPTVKPVCLMEHLIKLVTRQDQIVLDPFVGSGTTCIAARKLLRQYIGIDNNADYCEIAKRRLAAIPPPLEAFA